MQTDVFREIKSWKKPFHKTKANLARAYLKLLKNTKVIAITGSVGKTSAQLAIAYVLKQKYDIEEGDQNLDPTFRIPQTILKTKPWQKYIILEYGVEHPGEMDYYLSIARPNIGVYTKIAPTHLKYFKNIEGVFAEKSKMAKILNASDYLILNNNDPYSNKIKGLSKAKVVTYGEGVKNGVKISHFKQDRTGSSYRIHYSGQIAIVKSKLVGRHQLSSAYLASTIGILCGLTLKQIATGLSLVKPASHRLNLINQKDITILDDTYNSSPIAAEEAIKTLSEIGKGKKIAILGEMKDLGAKSSELHQKLGEFIAKQKIDSLITVGPVAKIISDVLLKSKFKGMVVSAKDTREAVKAVKAILHKNTIVLVKGSRHEHLERVVFALQNKSTRIKCYHCGKLK